MTFNLIQCRIGQFPKYILFINLQKLSKFLQRSLHELDIIWLFRSISQTNEIMQPTLLIRWHQSLIDIWIYFRLETFLHISFNDEQNIF